jgi:hypothetical protein
VQQRRERQTSFKIKESAKKQRAMPRADVKRCASSADKARQAIKPRETCDFCLLYLDAPKKETIVGLRTLTVRPYENDSQPRIRQKPFSSNGKDRNNSLKGFDAVMHL